MRNDLDCVIASNWAAFGQEISQHWSAVGNGERYNETKFIGFRLDGLSGAAVVHYRFESLSRGTGEELPGSGRTIKLGWQTAGEWIRDRQTVRTAHPQRDK